MITDIFVSSDKFREFAQRVSGMIDYYRGNVVITCTIPDFAERESLSGILATLKKIPEKTEYSGNTVILTYGAGKDSAVMSYSSETEKNESCVIL